MKWDFAENGAQMKWDFDESWRENNISHRDGWPHHQMGDIVRTFPPPKGDIVGPHHQMGDIVGTTYYTSLF
jgi:hypothetical protein